MQKALDFQKKYLFDQRGTDQQMLPRLHGILFHGQDAREECVGQIMAPYPPVRKEVNGYWNPEKISLEGESPRPQVLVLWQFEKVSIHLSPEQLNEYVEALCEAMHEYDHVVAFTTAPPSQLPRELLALFELRHWIEPPTPEERLQIVRQYIELYQKRNPGILKQVNLPLDDDEFWMLLGDYTAGCARFEVRNYMRRVLRFCLQEGVALDRDAMEFCMQTYMGEPFIVNYDPAPLDQPHALFAGKTLQKSRFQLAEEELPMKKKRKFDK